MCKAKQLAERLEQVDVEECLKLIEDSYSAALNFDVINDTMCVMHDDGSVTMISIKGGYTVCAVVTSDNILKVLQHYAPYKEVFTDNQRHYKQVFKNRNTH